MNNNIVPVASQKNMCSAMIMVIGEKGDHRLATIEPNGCQTSPPIKDIEIAAKKVGAYEILIAVPSANSQQMRYIILPQAIQRIVPPLAGQFISTIKDSAIVSVISVQELTFQGMELMASTFLRFEVWIMIALLYFLLTLTLSLSVERLEISMRRSVA